MGGCSLNITIISPTEAVIDGEQVLIGDAIQRDRVTATPLVKALLRWHEACDEARVTAINEAQRFANDAIAVKQIEVDEVRDESFNVRVENDRLRGAIQGLLAGENGPAQELLKHLLDRTPDVAQRLGEIERLQLVASRDAILNRLSEIGAAS